jgi:hypothetical protein
MASSNLSLNVGRKRGQISALDLKDGANPDHPRTRLILGRYDLVNDLFLDLKDPKQYVKKEESEIIIEQFLRQRRVQPVAVN